VWRVWLTGGAPLRVVEPIEVDEAREPGEAAPILPPIPRQNVAASSAGQSWTAPAVRAVMLGAASGGAILGLPATTIASAQELDLAGERMTVEELREARLALWATYVRADDAQAALPLSNGIGVGQANASADVRKVQERLSELGFDVPVNGKIGASTVRTIRVFEAIVTGREGTNGTSGRIQPGDLVHRALGSSSAPRWVKVPESGAGFVNGDNDGYGWATNRLVEAVVDSAARYQSAYRANNPSAAPIALNDASRRSGGATSEHETHEIGLDVDLYLPKKDGTYGKTKVGAASYDRTATKHMIAAFAQDPRVARILFSDPVILQEIQASSEPWRGKLVDGGPKHRDHIHVDISPPVLPQPAVLS
jgi:peptidoglycan hydrolase-like protein with peptidoglycan-binding domain